MSLLEFVNLTYTYDGQQPLLRGASGQLEQGKLYAILGPSDCGKTTLLSLLGGLDSPQGGRILFQGKDIAETGLGQHRRRHVAFIFQSYNLIDYLTPAENVALASKLPPLPLLERLGLTKEEARRSVLQLSGGIASLLRESAHQMGKCVVVVTHSRELARDADVVFHLKRGTLVTA